MLNVIDMVETIFFPVKGEIMNVICATGHMSEDWTKLHG